MRIPQYNFNDGVAIFNLGDVHRGDKACDVSAFNRTIAEIKNTGAKWVSTGDLLNVALKTSKSDCYSSMSLEDEKDALVKELSPIAGQCLGFVASNHHNRFDQTVGMSLDKIVAKELKVPFLGAVGLINVTCDAASYFIGMHHGIGGGKRRGGKINNLEDLSGIMPAADVYLEGHTHAFASFINEVPYIDRKRNSLRYYKSHFVTTGHYLNWEGSYAQDLKLKPMPVGCSVIELKAAPSGSNAKAKNVKIDFFQ